MDTKLLTDAAAVPSIVYASPKSKSTYTVPLNDDVDEYTVTEPYLPCKCVCCWCVLVLVTVCVIVLAPLYANVIVYDTLVVIVEPPGESWCRKSILIVMVFVDAVPATNVIGVGFL